MHFLLALAALLLPLQSFAEFHLIDVNELSVGYYDFFPKGRNPLVTGLGLKHKQLGKGVTLTLDVHVAKYLYMNNTVHSYTDESIGGGSRQFRTIGWQFEIGARPWKHLEVFYHHHSQHVLDWKYPYDGYPVEDSWGLRLVLIRKGKSDSLLEDLFR